MAKRIKKRRKFKFRFIWYLLFIFISYELIDYSFSFIKLSTNNEGFIKTLLHDTNSYIKDNDYNIFNIIIHSVFKLDNSIISTPYTDSNSFVYSETPIPRVYIYNTHDQEGYIDSFVEGYNLDPTIRMATSIFSDKLSSLGIPNIVEEQSVSNILDKYKMNFYQSYKISRNFVIDILKQYPDLELIIDLHRDALNREDTYVTIEDKNYAKVLFVVGQKYNTYKSNLELSNKISNKIKAKYPNLTRGIMMKDKEEQNGIYNQDLGPNIILLELGSNNNSFDEVYNTIEAIVPLIKEVLDEN